MNWQCRDESTHQSFYGMNRDTPYPKKSEDMIYSEGIKIIAHLYKPLMPPFEMIDRHLLPIICGKSPVLSFDSEIIRWSACLNIEMEQFRLYPCITPIPVNPDRNISF